MVRKPIVAGQFYSDYKEELNEQLNDSFKSKFGPGLPSKNKENDLIGVIAPHAGYVFSGPCAAWAYKEIAESKLPDTYILLGLSHQGFGTCVSLEDWETPLSIVKNDKEFGDKLDIKQDEKAHAMEHSIEVQIPFLQFANKENFKVVPIIVSQDMDYKEISEKIYEVIKALKRKVCIIASSDFTHYGVNYGYFPFQNNVRENLDKLDNGAIKHIEKLDAFKFLDYIETTKATICGKIPIAVALELSKKLGAKKAELLKYYNSGDISKDYGSMVGYGAIKIK